MTARLVVAEKVRTASGLLGDAVLTANGQIAAIGWADELRKADLPEERISDGVIVPGLRDAHLHPLPYALSLTRRHFGNLSSAEIHIE